MRSGKFLMRVSNNEEGRSVIKNLKKNLNTDSYRMWIRYSGPRPAGTYQFSTLKANATSIRVYVEYLPPRIINAIKAQKRKRQNLVAWVECYRAAQVLEKSELEYLRS